MSYRDEKEEKPVPPPPIVHEWHIFPKLRKLTKEDVDTITLHMWLTLFGVGLAATVVAALLGVAVAGCYFYDWRMGRLH